MDKEQRKNSIFGKLFMGFIAITVVLTSFSKSLYKYRLPVVTVASPKQGRLDLSVNGTAEFNGNRVDIRVHSEDASIAGEKADITIKHDGTLYDALIPITALQQDAKGYYVLVLQADDGVLGNGYKAARMAVDLLNSDKFYCAVQGIPDGESVIVEATNEIFDGDHVYYEGGDLYD